TAGRAGRKNGGRAGGRVLVAERQARPVQADDERHEATRTLVGGRAIGLLARHRADPAIELRDRCRHVALPAVRGEEDVGDWLRRIGDALRQRLAEERSVGLGSLVALLVDDDEGVGEVAAGNAADWHKSLPGEPRLPEARGFAR